jgi:hypothetical protein
MPTYKNTIETAQDLNESLWKLQQLRPPDQGAPLHLTMELVAAALIGILAELENLSAYFHEALVNRGEIRDE